MDLGPGIEGLAFPDGRILVSEETYTSAVRNLGRARMTLAHESYHGIRHCRQLRQQLVHRDGRLVLARRGSIPPYRDPEWQANTFAAALLMPADAVRQLFQEYQDREQLIRAITNRMLVSRQAAEIRVQQLGLAN
ncbi:Marine sediment metagenome DNA, contig: S01H1_L05206 OS=marine sediment metagenome GN=S01H1_13610 PE=4 SV=1: DUF955 [Gemmataceae bacterium]|nr:Marine sediment metagenome DNA, contig: S01H1_L05206 OS=marine sediment metagenome GN=S01H1_13610 PE=4 SV=1: DUF955 [Gemmataceae bacterium]VTT97600.1 Marine sediment metagenome DNA, contig: S01H1_L05206 OS=marine sediment metagenome GN=S01H1_13610 PE=4 SV=1: DUF955 [Gemmataceae bacterium]